MDIVETINLVDEYNKLKAENNRLREENYDLTLTFLLFKEKNADEIVKLREALLDAVNFVSRADSLFLKEATTDTYRDALKEKE